MGRLFGALLIGLLCVPSLVHAADIAGTWTGTWTKNGDALPVTVTFANENGTWSGSFDSDALQVSGIPFRDVRLSDSAAHWLLQGDSSATTFDGTLKGDTLSGEFVEGSTTGSFVLRRSAQPVQPVAVRDVSFADGAVSLAGSLITPPGKGPFPAVVFLHGSGQKAAGPTNIWVSASRAPVSRQ